MQRTRLDQVVRAAWPVLFVIGLSAGCAAPGPRGEIPLGRWSGQGVFVCEEWKPTEQSQGVSRQYATSLSIRPGELDGQPVIELEVRSERGRVPLLEGETTHFKAALLKTKRVSDSVVLYRLVSVLLDPGPGKSLKFDPEAPPLAASCTAAKGATILQIEYGDNFVDTFRFAGNRLEKSGFYFDTKKGLIHWVEHLDRCP